jgi:hypothetical protein
MLHKNAPSRYLLRNCLKSLCPIANTRIKNGLSVLLKSNTLHVVAALLRHGQREREGMRRSRKESDDVVCGGQNVKRLLRSVRRGLPDSSLKKLSSPPSAEKRLAGNQLAWRWRLVVLGHSQMIPNVIAAPCRSRLRSCSVKRLRRQGWCSLLTRGFAALGYVFHLVHIEYLLLRTTLRRAAARTRGARTGV